MLPASDVRQSVSDGLPNLAVTGAVALEVPKANGAL